MQFMEVLGVILHSYSQGRLSWYSAYGRTPCAEVSITILKKKKSYIWHIYILRLFPFTIYSLPLIKKNCFFCSPPVQGVFSWHSGIHLGGIPHLYSIKATVFIHATKILSKINIILSTVTLKIAFKWVE